MEVENDDIKYPQAIGMRPGIFVHHELFERTRQACLQLIQDCDRKTLAQAQVT